MARRLNPVASSEIDTSNTDPAYWEMILRREGLGMDRGLHPQVYVGSPQDLEALSNGAPLVDIKGHYGIVRIPDSE